MPFRSIPKWSGSFAWVFLPFRYISKHERQSNKRARFLLEFHFFSSIFVIPDTLLILSTNDFLYTCCKKKIWKWFFSVVRNFIDIHNIASSINTLIKSMVIDRNKKPNTNCNFNNSHGSSYTCNVWNFVLPVVIEHYRYISYRYVRL